MRNNVRVWLISNLPALLGVLTLAILAGRPLFRFEIMGGHDSIYYMPGAVEFYGQLSEGKLVPRWTSHLSGGYGLPYFIFRPPLYYYVSSLFHVIGFSFVASENLASFTFLLLAGVGMYLFARELYGSAGGLVAATAYLFAPYFLVNLYVRHSLLDFAAFGLMPFALWGTYLYARQQRERFLLLGALAGAAVILTSNTTALMFFPVTLLLTVWLAVEARDWRVLLRGIAVVGFAVGLSAYFWLPVLAERRYVHLGRAIGILYKAHFVFPGQLVRSPWGYGVSVPGDGDGMSFAVGLSHLILSVVALPAMLYARRRDASRNRWSLVAFFFVVMLACAFFATNGSEIFWDSLPLLRNLQFPWRFLSLIVLSTAFLSGGVFLVLPHDDQWLSMGVMFLAIVALLAPNLHKAQPGGYHDLTDEDYTPDRIASEMHPVTFGEEYEPIWVPSTPESPAPGLVTRRLGEGDFTAIPVTSTHFIFYANLVEPGLIQVNQFYYPDWTLVVDGVEQPLDYDEVLGAMTFPLEPGEHTAEVAFRSTPVRRWSGVLSGISAVALVAMSLLDRLRIPPLSRLLR